MADRTVSVNLRANVSDYVGKVRAAGQETTKFAGVAESTGKRSAQAWKGTGSSFSAAGSSLKQLLGVAAGTTILVKTAEYLTGAAQSASDLNEAADASRRVFGSSAGEIETWAAGADRAMGLSKRAALDAAVGFGDMFLQLGYGEKAAAGMTEQVVQMAGDLGSFRNMKTEDVIERISSGFRGEYDSLQKLLPSITDARVKTEAMAETGKKSAEALTAQEKATALLTLIQSDGARAMGNYAATADGAANAQKTAAASAENLKAKVGGVLLPALTGLATFGRDSLIPFLSGTVDGLVQVGEMIAPVASGVGSLVSGFAGLPGPLQAAALGLALFAVSQSKIVSAGKSVNGVLDALRLRVMYAADAAKTAAASGGFSGLTKSIGASAGSGLRGAASGLLGVLGGPWGLAFGAATAVVVGFVQAQANAAAAADAYSRTLDTQTGAVTKASAEYVASQLAMNVSTEDWSKVQQMSGLTLGQFTSAIVAGGSELDTFRGQFDALQTEADLGKWGDEGRLLFQALGNTLASVGKDADAGRAKAALLRDALKGQAEAAGQAGDATAGQADNQRDLNAVLADANQRIDDYIGKLRDAGLATLSTRQASRDLEQAIDDATEAVTKNGKGMDVTTQKGRDNQAALDGIAKSAQDVADAIYKETGSEQKMRDSLVKSRGSLIESGIRFGLTRKEAEKYADQVLKIPDKKALTVTAYTATASEAIDVLVSKINGMPTSRTIMVTTKMREIYDQRGMATGGYVSGPGTGTSDSIPAWLSNGEYVVKAAAVAKYGTRMMSDLNAMRFADGGMVGRSAGGSTSQSQAVARLAPADIARLAQAIARVRIDSTISAGSLDRAMATR